MVEELAAGLRHCGRDGCSPGHMKRKGPYVECYQSTLELKAKVAAAWNTHLLAGTEQGEGE